MTTILTVKGADFSANAVGFEPPVTDGLEGWFYLGNSAALSAKDLSFNSDALVVGTPTYSTGYVTCTSLSNYFTTSVADTAAGTILAVARWPSGQTGTVTGIISSAKMSGANTAVVEQYITSISEPSATLVGDLGFNAVPSAIFAQQTSNNIATRAFYAHSWSQAASSQRLRNLTAATTASGSITGTRQISDRIFRVGSSYNTRTGIIELSFWAKYSRQLTTTEEDSIYEFVQRFLADKRSLTI